MDGEITGLSAIYGPRSIGHNRRDSRQRKGFEEEMDGKHPGDFDPDEESEPTAKSALDPASKLLQNHSHVGRRDDQGRRHIDVLA